jgi:aspartate/methionine/tyrosine aminotransferase
MSAAEPPLPLRPEVSRLEPSKIVELWQLGFGRDDLIPLWVGESDLTTPQVVREAATRALAEGHTFYTHKRGWPELRAALDAYHGAVHGIRPGSARISLTSSGMQAIQLVLQAVLRPGDTLATLAPVWPNAGAAARILGGRVQEVALAAQPDGGFALDPDRLAGALGPETRALFLASPANPTGWTASRAELQAILELCRARGVWLIADEVYHRFVYGADKAASAPSVLELAEPEDPVVVVNSFSKTWAMTGWRLGWLVHPGSLAPVLDTLIEFNTSGAPAFLQAGALAAVQEGEPFVAELLARCRAGRDLTLRELGQAGGVTLAPPAGAFYAFPRVAGLTDSLAFAKRVLAETGVGVAPGAAFGPAGEGHLRLCFATEPRRLASALTRLRPLLA